MKIHSWILLGMSIGIPFIGYIWYRIDDRRSKHKWNTIAKILQQDDERPPGT